MCLSTEFVPICADNETSSTTLGFIEMSPKYALFPVPAYKISKAALNMLTTQYAQSFAAQGLTFLTISPGVRLPYCLS